MSSPKIMDSRARAGGNARTPSAASVPNGPPASRTPPSNDFLKGLLPSLTGAIESGPPSLSGSGA
ncbi:hypothetical protein C8Q76DRAFT_799530 [Earliella scabrosa]|nr:hypothetical protein C8Q76DRAFT_799530 [Earliella scabrosa]